MSNGRPAKRLKTDSIINASLNDTQSKETTLGSDRPRTKSSWRKQLSSDLHKGKVPQKSQQGHPFGDNQNQDQTSKHEAPKPHARTFSQPSSIRSGDRGILVTCNRGVEKKSLLELLDLVQLYLTEDSAPNLDGSERSMLHAGETKPADNVHLGDASVQTTDIETDIQAELASFRSPHAASAGHSASQKIDLITLDIPCVSFLRLPPYVTVDPTEIVQRICIDAATNTAKPKSRFVRRLTPVSLLQKVLNDGLEKLCDEILPKYFTISGEKGVEFAIKPTVRNNDKLDRDHIIKVVAERVHKLGQGKHKVNLKGYQLGILVEVYRTWVGMSVVENIQPEAKLTGSMPSGYEELKKYNLAEIYAMALPKG